MLNRLDIFDAWQIDVWWTWHLTCLMLGIFDVWRRWHLSLLTFEHYTGTLYILDTWHTCFTHLMPVPLNIWHTLHLAHLMFGMLDVWRTWCVTEHFAIFTYDIWYTWCLTHLMQAHNIWKHLILLTFDMKIFGTLTLDIWHSVFWSIWY